MIDVWFMVKKSGAVSIRYFGGPQANALYLECASLLDAVIVAVDAELHIAAVAEMTTGGSVFTND